MEVDVRLIPDNSESSGVSPYAATQAISQSLPAIIVVGGIYWISTNLKDAVRGISTDIANAMLAPSPVDAPFPDVPLPPEFPLIP